MIASSELTPASVAYFTLHLSPCSTSDIGVSSDGKLFMRQTTNDETTKLIPLGSCTRETIQQLRSRIDALAQFTELFGEHP